MIWHSHGTQYSTLQIDNLLTVLTLNPHIIDVVCSVGKGSKMNSCIRYR